MKHLFIKTFRDIKVYWSQFLGVFFMTLISIGIYNGMAVIWRGLDISVEEYGKECNMAHQWIYTKGISEEDLIRLESDVGIKNATYSAVIRSEIKDSNQYLELTALDNDKFMKPYVLKGEKYNPEGAGLWLDIKFAETNKLEPGDKLVVECEGIENEFEIKGLVLNIEKLLFTGSNLLTMPDHKTFGYAFISKESLNKLAPFYPYTEIRLGADSIISDEALESVLGDRFLFSEKREDMIFLKEMERESNQMMKMSILFSIVFILLSALTMYSSMSRLVSSQRTIIGTMKALGIHTWKIKIHYGLYGFFFSLLGSTIGLILGPVIISPIIVTMKESYIILPYWHLIRHDSVYLIILGLVSTCIFASLKTTGDILSKVPAVILRNVSNMDTVVKTGFLERLGCIWSKLPNGLKWTLRDNRRNKVRFLMGIVGVLGGMTLIIAGLGVTQTIEYANKYIYKEQAKYTHISEIKRDSQYKKEVFEKTDGEKEYNLNMPGAISKSDKEDGKEKTGLIIATDNNGLIAYKDIEGKEIVIFGDDVIITKKLAEQLDVCVGDDIRVKIKGIGEKTLKITKISGNLSPQGIIMSKEKWEKSFTDFMPNILLTKNVDAEELENNSLVLFTTTREYQLEQADKLTKSVESIMYILFLGSIILVVTIIYTLSTLNYIEREREYATLRVFGFRAGEIRGILLSDSVLTVIIGWIAGIFAASKFLDIYIKSVSLDSLEWIPYLENSSWIFATIVVVGVSLSAALVLSLKIRKIDLVASFKSVE